MPGLDPITLAGAGVGLIGGIAGLFHAGAANAQLNKLIGQDPSYSINPVAQQRLALAQTLLNARMPGAASASNNILETQANQNAGIERNATSGAQAIAAEAGAAGGANKAFEQLGEQEAQDYQRRYGNLAGAQEGIVQEGDKVYQSKVRQFEDMAQIRAAQNANTSNALSSLSNLGFGAMNYGLAGGYRRLYQQQTTATTAPQIPNAPYSRVNTPIANTSPGIGTGYLPQYINT